MVEMKLSMNEILLINALERISRVSAKDCIVEGNVITYMVRDEEVGKAIGKSAINVRELEQKLGKKIEIIGFCEKPENVLCKAFDIKIEDAKIKQKKLIIKLDALNKKKVFGKVGRLKKVKELIKRNYDLEMILN